MKCTYCGGKPVVDKQFMQCEKCHKDPNRVVAFIEKGWERYYTETGTTPPVYTDEDWKRMDEDEDWLHGPEMMELMGIQLPPECFPPND
jgi:hypothetical protein